MYLISDRKKTAIIYDDVEYSYRELINGIKYYGSLLNIELDDRVVIFSENRPEYIYSFFSVWDKKGIAVNIDAGYEVENIVYVLKDAKPKYIFTSELNYEKTVQAKAEANSDVVIFKFEDYTIPADFDTTTEGILEPPKEKVSFILYTSGTTGDPKGVMLTYGNVLSNINAVKSINLITPEDRMLALLPFHHILPLMGTLMLPVASGGLVVIIKEISSEAIRNALTKYKITIFVGVPRIWEMFHKGLMAKLRSNKVTSILFDICKKLDNKAISKVIFKKVHEAFGGHIKLLLSGGAKIDKEILEDFTALGFTMLEGYGLTETSPIIAFNRPGNEKLGTVGTPIPDVEVKIAEDGEVLARGANIMKGYYQKPEATAAAIDSEGWFHTGDLGYLDGEHLVISGRKKEMIVLSNGKNIDPNDIEIQLKRGSKLIKEVAIVENNKHLMALIFPDFDMAKHEGVVNIKEKLKWDILDKYNLTAPNYRKVLETKIITHELPKTRLGKLQRFKLVDLIREGDGEKTEEKVSDYVITSEYENIRDYLMTVHPEAKISPDSHMELDIGMDSLDNVELLSWIEATFSIEMKEEDLIEIKLVRELADFVRKNGGEYKAAGIDWKKILDAPYEGELPKAHFVGDILNFLFVKPFFKTYVKIEKKGLEKIPTTPVIFAGNHQSMLDAFSFAQLLDKSILDKSYFLAEHVNFQGPVKEALAANSHIILLDMHKSIKDSLSMSAAILRQGNNLVIFPEGARTRDGNIQDFKKSFAILSKELNIPVVPFVIKGARDLMPVGSSKIKSGTITIEVLDMIDPKDLTIDEIVIKTKGQIVDSLSK